MYKQIIIKNLCVYCIYSHLPCPVLRPSWTCTENFGRTTRRSWGMCTSCCSGKVTAETWERYAPTTSPNYCWPPPCLWNGPSRTSQDRLSVHRCTRPTLSTAKYIATLCVNVGGAGIIYWYTDLWGALPPHTPHPLIIKYAVLQSLLICNRNIINQNSN